MKTLAKYWTFIFLIAGIIGIIWGVCVNWADGSWVLAIGGVGLFLLIGVVNWLRTGIWFTESSGGH